MGLIPTLILSSTYDFLTPITTLPSTSSTRIHADRRRRRSGLRLRLRLRRRLGDRPRLSASRFGGGDFFFSSLLSLFLFSTSFSGDFGVSLGASDTVSVSSTSSSSSVSSSSSRLTCVCHVARSGMPMLLRTSHYSYPSRSQVSAMKRLDGAERSTRPLTYPFV